MNIHTDKRQLASHLQRLLDQKDLRPADLARKSGVSMASLSRILSGKVNPSFGNVARLAQALEVSLDQFFLASKPADQRFPSIANAAKEAKSPEQAAAPANMFQFTATIVNDQLNIEHVAQHLNEALNGPDLPNWGAVLNTQNQINVRVQGQRLVIAAPQSLLANGEITAVVSLAQLVASTGATLSDLQLPDAYVGSFNGPALGADGIRDMTHKFGRPLLAAQAQTTAQMAPRMAGRLIFEALRGGLDFSYDATLLPAMQDWRQRFRFAAEGVHAAMQDSGEYKYHAVNVTAGSWEEIQRRADYAQELNHGAIMVDAAAIGWSSLQSLAKWAREQDVLLMVPAITGMNALSPLLTAKLTRLAGADIVALPNPLQAGGTQRRQVQGIQAALTQETTSAQYDQQVYHVQNFPQQRACLPCVQDADNLWHLPALLDASSSDVMLNASTLVYGHPWGAAAGSTALRVATESIVKASAEGTNTAVDGRNVLADAQKHSPELRVALDHWQEGSYLFGVVLGDIPDGGKVTAFPASKVSKPAEDAS